MEVITAPAFLSQAALSSDAFAIAVCCDVPGATAVTEAAGNSSEEYSVAPQDNEYCRTAVGRPERACN